MPYSRTEYTRVLVMDIIDRHRSTQDKLHKVFEGRVVSTGSSSQFAMVSDCLIDAMFEGFPGQSGESNRVTSLHGACGKAVQRPPTKTSPQAVKTGYVPTKADNVKGGAGKKPDEGDGLFDKFKTGLKKIFGQ